VTETAPRKALGLGRGLLRSAAEWVVARTDGTPQRQGPAQNPSPLQTPNPQQSATPAASPLSTGRELIRSGAKWIIASFAAVGAILVAGSQLSSIGALTWEDSRLWYAVAGLAVAMLAVLLVIVKVVSLLAPREWTINDLVKASKENPKPRVVQFFEDNYQFLDGYASLEEIQQDWDNEDDPVKVAEVNETIDRVVDRANYQTLSYDFKQARWLIAGGALLAAAGIGLFAWAANPEKPDQPPASLRNAKLVGANLSGANLKKADLTGADLTTADLRGANLADATLDRVTWSHTLCPDGTNSDASARPDKKTGKLSGGSCLGHLSP
jgi:hypothetical protein